MIIQYFKYITNTVQKQRAHGRIRYYNYYVNDYFFLRKFQLIAPTKHTSLQLYIDTEAFAKWSGYKLIQELGSGAYSTVFKAIHIASGKQVAIKQENDIFMELGDCKRILREVRLLRQLSHPSIIKIYDVFINKAEKKFNTLYVVLELADASLKDVISSPIYLVESQIRKIMYQIICALKYLKSAGVLHRDLKPANVLVYENCTTKICDFGLSRTAVDTSCPLALHRIKRKKRIEAKKIAFKEGAPLENLSKEEEKKSPSGTPTVTPLRFKKRLTMHVVTRWYRAPEVVLMQKDYGFPIDIWAVGCIFAELQETKKDNVPHYVQRRPLLPGTSCYPLSPKIGGSEDKRDQLNMIMNLIGTPVESDLSFVDSKELIDTLLKIPKKIKRDFLKMYPSMTKEGIDLINKLLSFNPYSRLSIEEALDHPYFTPIRKKENEITAPHPIIIEFDDVEKMGEAELRKHLLEEVEYFEKLKKQGKLFS